MMKFIIAWLLLPFVLLIKPGSSSAENAMFAANGGSGSPQIMLSAVAEPGSPVVGKSYSITDDLTFVVGYRLWLNYWQTTIAKVITTVPDPHTPTDAVTITNIGDGPTINQFAASSIPSVGVRYGNFFASASVLISPDYYFPTKTELVSGPTSAPFFQAAFGDHTYVVEHKVRGSRNEVDINLGYYIHPWIAVTTGYKGVFQKLRDKSRATNITPGHPVLPVIPVTETSKPRYNGGTLGVAVNVPIPEGGWIPSGFNLYGNGGGGPMASNDFSYAWYGTLDAGLAYKPMSLPLVFTAGYKFQIINSKTKSGARENHVLDYTRGAILGISFIF